MSPHRIPLTLLSFFLFFQLSFSQTHIGRTVNIPGANCGGYYEYLPVNYNASSTTKYPLLIYIHGNGAYGNGSAAAMNIVLQEGVPRIINLGQFPSTLTVNGQTSSFIVISPQFFSKASPLQTKNFIDYILNSNYQIDLNRVYLTGFSVGGDVAWKAPMNLASATRLAALCPVAGYNSPYTDTTAQFIASGNLPVWAIHSNSDGVPVAWSQDMVDKINSYNPITPAIISRPNNVTHENTHIVVYDPGYKPNGKNIYEWCLQYSRNYAPIAMAGSDQNLVLPINQTSLTGAGSMDPDGTAITYQWNKISGPSQYIINNPALSNPLISDLVAGTYQFQLKVTDGDGLQGYDTVQVTVINPNPNQLPVADAGNNETVYLPQNSATLIGNNSSDPDGVVEGYSWQKISGPSQYTFTNPSSASTNVINLQVGTYQFKLTVTDNEGGVASDTVEITVINPFPNMPPVANAGNTQSITLPQNSVQLNGTGSSDPDGVIVSYAWTQISGPSSATLNTPGQIITGAANLVEGLYQFELLVVDDSSALSKDTVSVFVNPLPAVTQKYIQVNIYSGSNGAGTGWNNWNVQSSLNLNSTTYSDGSASPVRANLTLNYGVADNGASYPVTMCPLPVGRTSSYSTVNRSLFLTGLDNSKTYDLEIYGSRAGSAVNSTRYITGGTTITIYTTSNYSNKAQFTNLTPTGGQIRVDLQRVNTYNYINGFILTERSSNGGGGPANTAPVAVPGSNQVITLPTSTITLNGSASYDPDGSIASYSWSKVSGPAATITNPGNVSTTVTNLVQGTYIFQLSVTDNQGATAYGNIQVIVNEEYIPPSGGDSLNCGNIFKIVVLGSSTAAGTGATPIDSSWANKFKSYLRSKNVQNQLINLAAPGYTTYHVLNPTGYNPPSGRPQPDPNRNITRAFYYNPDLIIINLPSNDNASDYTLQEQKDNYERTMALANAAGVPVFVATTQPRNNLTTAQMNNQIAMRDWTYQRFGQKAIDFWTTIANGNGTINSQYNADGIHVNNAGHHILFTRVIAERMLDTLCLMNNLPPVAKAGNDVLLYLPANSTQLNGSGSYDPDGSISSYSWAKVSGPLQFSMSNATVVNPVVSNLVFGVYQFEIRVTDNLGVVSKDTMEINVATSDPVPPVANAGNNRIITLPQDTIHLNAAGSYDPDGVITNYNWVKVSGPDASILNPGNAMTVVSGLQEGEYTFELMVLDNDGMSAKDSVYVTVLPVPNQPPIAVAGPDISIPYPENSVQLNGSLSVDNDGSIIGFRWKNVSAAGQYLINDSTLVTPVISNLVSGTYIFELTVTDDDGDTGRDTIAIQVGYPPNQSPVAHAGDDQNITLPVSTITLNGLASYDPDGSIVSYNWIKVSGPSATITNINNPVTTVTGLTAGNYVFRLTITDNQGATDADLLAVNVYPPLNTLPVANAGPDQAVTLPNNNVTLNGSSSFDNNGTIVSYQWSQVAGPSNANFGSPSQPVTAAGNLIEGLYQFELLVIDDSSTTGKDTISVLVNPAPTVTQKYVQVNIYSGSNGAGTGWNNWNVQSSLNLNSTTYSDGTASPVRASITLNYGVADNGASYPVTMCPVPVGRTASYSTVNRYMLLTGLDNNKTYDLELYGSRAGSAVNSTRYIIGSTTITIYTTGNYSNKAVFTNLTPTGGQIRVDLQRVNTYNYINGFILTEYTNNSSLISRGVTNENSSFIEEQQQKSTSKVIFSNEKIDTQVKDSFYVLPNPVKGDFKLIGNSNEKGSMEVKIYNLDGKVVRDMRLDKPFEHFEKQIQFAGIKSGMYFIRIRINNKLYVVRIMSL